MGRCPNCDETVTATPRVIDERREPEGGLRTQEWVCPNCETILGVTQAHW